MFDSAIAHLVDMLYKIPTIKTSINSSKLRYSLKCKVNDYKKILNKTLF